MEHVKLVEKRMANQYPSGVDSESFRDIPVLMERIRELETALLPFAYAGKDTPADVENAVVRSADCRIAAQALTLERKAARYEYPL